MNNAIAIGPLLLPFTLLLVLVSAGATLALGKWLSKEASADVEKTLGYALIVGLVAARMAFVYEYRSLYLDSPLTIVDIRDGGWNATFGVIGAWMAALYRARRAPATRRPLRWALAVGTAVFVIGTVALSIRPTSGQKLPELAFASLDGPTAELKGFQGKPTVVNLWATWCAPCAREMPVLEAAQRERPDVHFVFLNQGEDVGQVAKWLALQRLALRNVLLDPKRQASASFRQMGYPTTLFFDARGELVATRLGELSPATLKQKLQDLTPTR